MLFWKKILEGDESNKDEIIKLLISTKEQDHDYSTFDDSELEAIGNMYKVTGLIYYYSLVAEELQRRGYDRFFPTAAEIDRRVSIADRIASFLDCLTPAQIEGILSHGEQDKTKIKQAKLTRILTKISKGIAPENEAEKKEYIESMKEFSLKRNKDSLSSLPAIEKELVLNLLIIEKADNFTEKLVLLNKSCVKKLQKTSQDEETPPPENVENTESVTNVEDIEDVERFIPNESEHAVKIENTEEIDQNNRREDIFSTAKLLGAEYYAEYWTENQKERLKTLFFNKDFIEVYGFTEKNIKTEEDRKKLTKPREYVLIKWEREQIIASNLELKKIPDNKNQKRRDND